MKEGNCIFSGHAIIKGKGITQVRADGRAMLISKKKCRHFIDNKIKPRSVAWTQSSRTLHKKENVVKEQKIEIPRVVKIVRGFPSVPASLIIERMEKAKEAKEAKAEKKDAKKDDNRFTKTEKLRKSDTKRK